ncbi:MULTISPECIES: hypothetical protein [unclassified Rhizobacter]|uniref:hypothetical protein n=1 Tax=unclassified Rhizobacter TaxID=2640088 RepID=UPI0012F8F616|nr:MULTISPECIES: hypothetical protein [unclassified Rhizobacter]
MIRTLSRRSTPSRFAMDHCWGAAAQREAEADGDSLRLYVDGRFEGWIDGVARL